MCAGVAQAGPLVDAVKRRDAAEVRALLADKVDVNAREGDGATALHWAVSQEDATLVSLLLEAGATPGPANDLGVTPLHLASALGNADLVTRLLTAGAAADPATPVGVTPLRRRSCGRSRAATPTSSPRCLPPARTSARAPPPAR
jgi:ankyrin repeat protein